ncbi:hypothetical protein [Sphingomonas piscis]|uniref:hypothetical protein n=1 Tax=Sphingomonas piscis TaxID=2714943 RepID=UPI001FE8223C|nr:hypothetical protein [Sphingomonas piscis]
MILGQERAVELFSSAWARRVLHHAWLLAGPRGIGKATFARLAATRVLADAAGPAPDLPNLETPEDHPIAKLVDAGSHPDLRWLERLENSKTGNLYRNVSVDQIRSLGDLVGTTPFMSPWRAVVIDSVDDLEASGANALLKMLEEPPPTPCSCWWLTHRAACFQRSDRAAAGWISTRLLLTSWRQFWSVRSPMRLWRNASAQLPLQVGRPAVRSRWHRWIS